MARQGGWVQLEQSDMRLAMNMAIIAEAGFSCAAFGEMTQLIKECRAEVREEKTQEAVFPEHKKAKAAIKRRPVIVRENQTDRCLPYHNSRAKNAQTHWSRNGTCAPAPQPAPPRPGTAPAPAGDSERSQSSKTEGVLPGCVYIRTPLPSASVSNSSSFGPGRFYRPVWQRPYPIKNRRFFQQIITLRQQVLIREFSVWYVKYAALHGASFGRLRFSISSNLSKQQPKNDNNFKAACWVLKITKIGDRQKMRRQKLHISYTKYKILQCMFKDFIEGTIWQKPGPNRPVLGFRGTAITETVWKGNHC